MKTIDKLKKKLLCNPKIKFAPVNFPMHDGRPTKSLSEILETEVPEKYFLSEKMTQYLVERATQTQDNHKPRLVEHSSPVAQ